MGTQFHRLYQIYEKSSQSDTEKNILFRLFGDDSPLDDLSFYQHWESLFQKIDEENWEIFKAKVVKVLPDIQIKGKLQIVGELQKSEAQKEFAPFRCLDTFNEVYGYLFLKNEVRCETVKFLEESKIKDMKKPDLEGWKDDTQFVLEVKTINTSDDQHFDLEKAAILSTSDDQPLDLEKVEALIEGHDYPHSSLRVLKNLKDKINKDIEEAMKQLGTYPTVKKAIFL